MAIGRSSGSPLHRLLWFVALYAAGVGTLAGVAFGLRALLKALA